MRVGLVPDIILSGMISVSLDTFLFRKLDWRILFIISAFILRCLSILNSVLKNVSLSWRQLLGIKKHILI